MRYDSGIAVCRLIDGSFLRIDLVLLPVMHMFAEYGVLVKL